MEPHGDAVAGDGVEDHGEDDVTGMQDPAPQHGNGEGDGEERPDDEGGGDHPLRAGGRGSRRTPGEAKVCMVPFGRRHGRLR